MPGVGEAILATLPIAHFPMNELAGTTFADDTGNGHVGTLAGGTVTHGVGGMAADGTAVQFNAGAYMELVAADFALNARSFAVGMFVNLPVDSTRYLFDAFHSVSPARHLHIVSLSNGALGFNFYFSDLAAPPGSVVTSTRHFLVFRHNQTTDVLTIFVDGVPVATNNQGPLTRAPISVRFGASYTGSNSWNAKAQHLTIWRDVIPSDADIAAIWAERDAGTVTLPDDPGAFVEPVLGQVVYADSVDVEWGASAGADSYKLEFSDDDGGSWTPVASGIVGETYAADTTTWPTTLLGKLRVAATNGAGDSDWTLSDTFEVRDLVPGLNHVGDGQIFYDDHDAPGLGPRDEMEVLEGAWLTDYVPDPLVWDPQAPLGTRWREGYGFFLPLPGAKVLALRQNIKRLRAYGGGFYDPDTDTWSDAPIPEISADNRMVLQSLYTADELYGYITTKRAEFCVWRDPVTEDAFILDLNYPASLRRYSGSSGNVSAGITGTLHIPPGWRGGVYYPDWTLVAGVQPYKGSFGSVYDDDKVSIGFSVKDGVITLTYYGVGSGAVSGATKWVSDDLSAYIAAPGGVAYLLSSPYYVPEIHHTRLVVADYIEVSGLPVGAIVRIGARVYSNWTTYDTEGVWVGGNPPVRTAAAITFVTMESVADGSGVALLGPAHSTGLSERYVHDGMPEWLAEGLDLLDATINAPDGWTFDYVAVLIDEVTEVDRYTDEKNIRIGNKFVWDTLPLPAFAPGAFTAPLVDEVVGAVNPYTVAWGVATHPDAEAVEYELDYAADGVTFVNVAPWQSAATFDWDHALLPFTRSGVFRVRARGDVSLLPSGYRYSDAFVLYHAADPLEPTEDVVLDPEAPPRAPGLPLIGEVVGLVTQGSVYLQPLESPDGHKATRWRIWDSLTAVLVLDITATGADRDGFWVTGLTEAKRYDVTHALIDYLDVEGPQSNVRDFWTLKLETYKPHYAIDEAGATSGGQYRNIAPGGGDVAGMPELLGGGGARLNKLGVGYSQDPVEFPTATHHFIRFTDPAEGFVGGDGYASGWTAMVVYTPQDLSVPRELFGKPGSLFAWHDEAGGLRVAAVSQSYPQLYGGDEESEVFVSGNNNFDFSSTSRLEEDVMQVVTVGGKDAWFEGLLAIIESVPPVPFYYRIPKYPAEEVELLEMWAGVGGNFERQILLGVKNGTTDVSDRFLREEMDVFDIGHGSTNTDIGSDNWAWGRYARGIAHAFLFWHTLLTQDEVKLLSSFIEAGDVDAFWAHVANMDDQPYCYSMIREYPRPDKPTAVVI